MFALVLGASVCSVSFAQVDIAGLATSSMVALKASGTAISDSVTSITFSSGTTPVSTGYYNLVGNTSGSPAFSIAAATNVSNTAGTGVEQGVIFRLWLGAYDIPSLNGNTNLAAIVGINPTNATAKATFGVMAVVSNSGSSGSVYVLDSGLSTGAAADQPAELTSKLGVNTASNPMMLVQNVNPLTNTSFLSYKSVTGVFNGASDSNDAFLTFAVPFSAINVASTSTARSGSAFGVNTQWNFTVGILTNVVVPTLGNGTALTGTVRDYFNGGSGSKLAFSDAVTANGTTTTGSFTIQADVPEESTAILLPAFLGPVAGIAFWRRRAAKRAAQAKAAAAN